MCKLTGNATSVAIFICFVLVALPFLSPVHLSASQSTIHVGVFAQESGSFDQTYSQSMMQKFYNVVFGTGVFNSLEMFTPLGVSYSNSLSDMEFAQQVVQLAQLAEANNPSIRMGFVVIMDLQYNGSNREYTQLQNFLNAVQAFPEVSFVGINWERSTWKCDAFNSACGLSNANLTELQYSVKQFQTLVQNSGKVFASYYGPPNGLTNPDPTANPWYSVGYTTWPWEDPYWTAGWFVSPQNQLTYIGMSAGLFIGLPIPNGPFYAKYDTKNSTENLSSCNVITNTTSSCGPWGQWNNVTVDFYLKIESQIYQQTPSARQYIEFGVDRLSDPAGELIDPTLPAQYWNSAQFQGWARASEATYGLSIPVPTSTTTSLTVTTSTTSNSSSQSITLSSTSSNTSHIFTSNTSVASSITSTKTTLNSTTSTTNITSSPPSTSSGTTAVAVTSVHSSTSSARNTTYAAWQTGSFLVMVASASYFFIQRARARERGGPA